MLSVMSVAVLSSIKRIHRDWYQFIPTSPLASEIDTLMTGPSSAVDVSKLAAPLLFGPLVNWALYGVLCVQTCTYLTSLPPTILLTVIYLQMRVLTFVGGFDDDDKPQLAYFVFLLETVQTALTGADVHYWFIQGFGNVEQLKDSHYAPIDIPIVDSIISLVVQEYFCYRIWTLNRRLLWPCVAIAIVAVVQSTGAAWGGVKANISVMLGRYAVSKAAYYLWSLPSALADILIAITMIVLLRQTRAIGHYSNYVLLRIVRLTVETNALTGIYPSFDTSSTFIYSP
ncbi:hypothetical protein F5888DRAFT_1869716 [Russula emetica]|nr:hypothetical protein F5888DRAFT_1869716 [Russula emetica]